jgi:hypothetical protein
MTKFVLQASITDDSAAQVRRCERRPGSVNCYALGRRGRLLVLTYHILNDVCGLSTTYKLNTPRARVVVPRSPLQYSWH